MPAKGLLAVPLLACLLAAAPPVRAELPIPSTPQQYFNDYAGLVSATDAARMDDKLRSFEQASSNQIVVAIFPEVPGPSLEDFTVRTAQAWRVGQKKLDNGAVLFVFVKEHKSRLEVGYGLEPSIPDLVANRILQDVMKPRFRQGQYSAGLDAAIDAIVAAAKGQGAPAGNEVPRRKFAWRDNLPATIVFGIFALVVISILLLFVVAMVKSLRRAFGGGGSSRGWSSGTGIDLSSAGSSSSFSTGGDSSFSSASDSSSSGGSDFSGGGGSFGGGGASGDW
ncbi:MAG: TPM domain-containing protein [Vicinamibacteria bacterium]